MTLAERARDLLSRERTGALATLSSKHEGYPFASIMPYSLDGTGQPILLISDMAVHTRNLLANPKASLLAGETTAPGEALTAERATLLGEAKRLDEEESAAVQDGYLARHPDAAQWVHFGDFSFWRMEVREVYYIGGFGEMGWASAEDYASAVTE